MFRKKFKHLHDRISGIQMMFRELDMSLNRIVGDHYKMMQKYDALTIIKMDMAKMDALTAMVSELARRLDLAGVADLPNTCVCEACGCKK